TAATARAAATGTTTTATSEVPIEKSANSAPDFGIRALQGHASSGGAAAVTQSRKSRADMQFERLYRKHAAAVYRYAYAVLRNQADAEDATQTTLMNAYRAIERGERPEKPHNWLIAIAHN